MNYPYGTTTARSHGRNARWTKAALTMVRIAPRLAVVIVVYASVCLGSAQAQPLAVVERAAPTEAPAVAIGTRVRWGGMIAAIHRPQELDPALLGKLSLEPDLTRGRRVLEIIGHALDAAGRPRRDLAPQGRFLTVTTSPLTSEYEPGRELTVTGIVSAEVFVDPQPTAPQSGGALPVVRSEFRDLWPRTAPRPLAAIRGTPLSQPHIQRPYPVYGPRYYAPEPYWVLAPVTIGAALLADDVYFRLHYGYGWGASYWGHRHGRHRSYRHRYDHGYRSRGWHGRRNHGGGRSRLRIGISGGFNL